MPKDQNPHHDDAKPESEHSPPTDRGGRSWKIGVTIGYGFVFSAMLVYSMVHDKDVLLTFLAGAGVLLLLILFVWHPHIIGKLNLRVNINRYVGFASKLKAPQQRRDQNAVDTKRITRLAESDPREVLRGTEELAARKDEQKSKRNNGNSAIRKGQKRRSSR
ncbi:hypothetical protein [Arthrobacter sp. efr-133-TYG-104]|uniref:hypothetical protein n=1 Tax=Arthrobacter sp. efr-133-TYG-104 TaxID=3040324 RepID=UPI00254AC722|nr:hypothetical protein [Arthrobacter sp. efr-133-TYG-104]